MTSLPVQEARLNEEITDLKSALSGLPPSVRDQGLFASYELRLRSLQEELLSLRLRRLKGRYPKMFLYELHHSSAHRVSNPLAELSDAIEWISLREHRTTLGFRYMSFALAGVIVACGIALASDNFWRLALSHLGVGMTIAAAAQIILGLVEERRMAREGQMKILRHQLELIKGMVETKQPPEQQIYERTLAMLDDAGVK